MPLDSKEKSAHELHLEQVQRDATGQREVTVQLCVPITIDGVERETLTLRRPTVGDFIEMQKKKGTDAEQERWLISRLTKVAPEVLNAVDSADWDVLTAVLLGFRGARVAD